MAINLLSIGFPASCSVQPEQPHDLRKPSLQLELMIHIQVNLIHFIFRL